MNNGMFNGWKTVTVQTGFGPNVQLHDYSGHGRCATAAPVWTSRTRSADWQRHRFSKAVGSRHQTGCRGRVQRSGPHLVRFRCSGGIASGGRRPESDVYLCTTSPETNSAIMAERSEQKNAAGIRCKSLRRQWERRRLKWRLRIPAPTFF